MKRKNLMTAMMCTVCLAVSSAAPMAVMAEETELLTEAEDTAEEEDAVEAETADGGEESEESTEGETEVQAAERPEYKALDYVTLGEYKGLSVTKGSEEVTDDEVDQKIQSNIQSADVLESITEGAVQEGDTANIDYEGKLDGEAFAGGTAEGYDLVIGSGTFIDGFEEGLVGVAVGETVDLPLTFPENYGNEELAGQDVVFTVTLNEIKRAPELSDELAGTLSDGACSDVESYRASVRSELEAEKADAVVGQMKYDLFTQVANLSEIKDYPQEMLDYSLENMKSYYQQMAEAYGMEFSDFMSSAMGMTEEEFETEALAVIKQNMQQELLLLAIAETEGLEVSEEEFAKESAEFAEETGYESAEELIAAYGEATVRISILQNQALQLLLDNAIVETEAETEAETGAEAESEAATEEGAEAESEAVTEEGAETESGAEAETEPETESEIETETVSE